MQRTPCEHLLWDLLPAIRNEIARSMVNDFNLNQKETANKLGITSAAVSMYLSDKRGNIKIRNKKIISEVKISAGNIIKDKNTDLVKETCRLCNILKSKKNFPFYNSITIDKKKDLVLCKI